MSSLARRWFSLPAYRIQYIPREETAAEDALDKPPAPIALLATGSIGRVSLSTDLDQGLGPNDVVEFYASIDNNRSNAQRVMSGSVLRGFQHELPYDETRYYWVRVRRVQDGPDAFSDFYPLSATAGVVATSSATGTPDIIQGAVTQASWSRSDSQFNWTASDDDGFFLSRLVFPHESSSKFIDVSFVFEAASAVDSYGGFWIEVRDQDTDTVIDSSPMVSVGDATNPTGGWRSFQLAYQYNLAANPSFSLGTRFQVRIMSGPTGGTGPSTFASRNHTLLVRQFLR